MLAVGLLGGVAAATAGCGNGGSSASSDLPRGEDLVIGACVDLTGTAAVAGTAAQRGLQVAVDRINQFGLAVGKSVHQIRLVVRDTASDPTAAKSVAQELIADERVIGLVAAGATATANAIADVAEAASVPLIAAYGTDNTVRPVPQRRFVFKLMPNAADVAGRLVDAISANSGRKVGLLATADDYGDTGRAAVGTAIGANGGLTLVRSAGLPIGGNDYQDVARLVLAGKPDAVIVWGVAPVPGLAARALRAAGYTGTILFDPGAASDDTMSGDNRSATKGALLVSPSILGGPPPSVTTPAAVAQRDYFDQYTRLYGAFSGLSTYAADALNLLAEGAKRAGSSDRLKIRNGLESIPFDGLAGGYQFSTIDHGGVQADSLGLFRVDQTGWLPLD
jgi:branched-chain amino acid transport system substrate-binding protein